MFKKKCEERHIYCNLQLYICKCTENCMYNYISGILPTSAGGGDGDGGILQRGCIRKAVCGVFGRVALYVVRGFLTLTGFQKIRKGSVCVCVEGGA